IQELGALAAERDLRFHVDACIGGWVLPFTEVPRWDLRVEGVTSLSVDLHKYAYTPKGASLLLHRTPQLRRPQFFAFAGWPGYTMLNATTQSTKSGGPLAAAWAVVQHIGRDGYQALARAALDATAQLAQAVATMEHLAPAAPPEATLLAIETGDAL